SRSPHISEGECVYGYFPMATHLVLEPGALSGARFADTTAHRRGLPPTYNEYVLINRDPGYDKNHGGGQLVLRPPLLFSFFCSEWLKAEQFFGASQILISSASSKTSLGLAFLLRQARLGGIDIVGLTSATNLSFVTGRGVYDSVITYDEISALSGRSSV